MKQNAFLHASMIFLVSGLLIYLADAHFFISWVTLRNYLPDGLWAASFVSFICFIWHDNEFCCYAWGFIAILSMLAFELLQYLGIINGTGDPLDAVIYLVFSLLVVAIYRQNTVKIKKTNI